MKEDDYHPIKSGEVRYSNNGGFSYFWPYDLPFDIELDKKTYKKAETAIIVLSKWDGKVSQMSEQERNILEYVGVSPHTRNGISGEGSPA